jgi:phosphopantetheinyl transferase
LPVLFQHTINNNTQLGVWRIEEPESFFANQLPTLALPSSPHKRLQHMAGRFLLQYLQPDFPIHQIHAKPGNKPFLPSYSYHFSISHSRDMAAAIISNKMSVGIDVELISDKAKRVGQKFIHASETRWATVNNEKESHVNTTLIWSIKETIFKWYGLGNVDFKNDIQIQQLTETSEINMAECFFKHAHPQTINVNYLKIDEMILTWK